MRLESQRACFSPNDRTSMTAKNTWDLKSALEIYSRPFNDLLFEAQSVARIHHNANTIQASTLLSIKTGACPEDCAYCPQSARYDTGLEREKLLPVEEVREAAKAAKATGGVIELATAK